MGFAHCPPAVTPCIAASFVTSWRRHSSEEPRASLKPTIHLPPNSKQWNSCTAGFIPATTSKNLWPATQNLRKSRDSVAEPPKHPFSTLTLSLSHSSHSLTLSLSHSLTLSLSHSLTLSLSLSLSLSHSFSHSLTHSLTHSLALSLSLSLASLRLSLGRQQSPVQSCENSRKPVNCPQNGPRHH